VSAKRRKLKKAEKRLEKARMEIEEELKKIHDKRLHSVGVHAYYIPEKKGFKCGFAETEYGSKDCGELIYSPAEIVEHLERVHSIKREEQIIKGWKDHDESSSGIPKTR